MQDRLSGQGCHSDTPYLLHTPHKLQIQPQKPHQQESCTIKVSTPRWKQTFEQALDSSSLQLPLSISLQRMYFCTSVYRRIHFCSHRREHTLCKKSLLIHSSSQGCTCEGVHKALGIRNQRGTADRCFCSGTQSCM